MSTYSRKHGLNFCLLAVLISLLSYQGVLGQISTYDQTASQAVRIQSNEPNANKSSADNIRANIGSTIFLETVIEFDMGVIPQGALVLEAELTLERNANYTHTNPLYCQIQLMRMTKHWHEDTITWNMFYGSGAGQLNYPVEIDPTIVADGPTTTTGDQHVDVTRIVRDLVALPDSMRHGFHIKLRDNPTWPSRNVYWEKDPRLVIKYMVSEPVCDKWEGDCGYLSSITRDGSVGIGTVPTDTFHVAGGNARFEESVKVEDSLGVGTLSPQERFHVASGANALVDDTLFVAHRLIVGDLTNTAYPEALLSVDGLLIAKQLRSTPQAWADYVFGEEYQLMELDSLRSFIEENGHLPGIPSEKEVLSNGIEHAEMDAALLGKIEELTLYILEQENLYRKEISEMRQELQELRQLIDSDN